MEVAKKEGWLPWKHWYESESYRYYLKAMKNYYKPLEIGNAFFW